MTFHFSRRIFCMLFLVLANGCKSEIDHNNQIISNDSLKQRILLRGDVEAYSSLYTKYENNNPEDFVFWALIMANRYNNTEAHLDVFWCFKSAYDKGANSYNFKEMDSTTKRWVMSYLKVAKDRKADGVEKVWQDVIRTNPDLSYLDSLRQ